MTFPSRWKKIATDILHNAARTILVILSIAVGVFAIGITTNSGRIIKRDMNEQYLAINPDSATIYISPFYKDLLNSIRNARAVEMAEARRIETVEVERTDGSWDPITLNALTDYESIEINRFTMENGLKTPARGEIYLERSSAAYLEVNTGDTLLIRLPGTTQTFRLNITGTIHDLHAVPPDLLLQTNAYISMDTLQWMGMGRWYNTLLFTVKDNTYDKNYNMEVAGELRDRIITPAGYTTASIMVEQMGLEAGKHWADRDVGGLILILNVMGVLCIFLTVGLIVNTISALMQRQIKQIGIIRLIGGLRSQVFWMYIVNVLILAACAVAIALPTSLLVTSHLTHFAASYINFNITRIDITPSIALLQIGIGMLVPLGAAAVPITSGTSITVYDAVYQSDSITVIRQGILEKVLTKLRGLTSPIILSIRNTFRNRSRLLLTLGTLMLAGAAFIAAPSTHRSILSGFDQMIRYWQYDAEISIPGGLNIHTARREAKRATGAYIAEGWYRHYASFLDENGRESEAVEIMALPPDAHTIAPVLVQGRWLNARDTNALVINEDLLDMLPHLETGMQVTLRINGLERDFEIVGIASRHVFGARAYTPYHFYTKLIGQQNRTNLIREKLQPIGLQSSELQTQAAAQLEEHFQTLGYGQGTSTTQAEMLETAVGSSSIVLFFLLLMAAMLALVGGLGLAGTMSLGVMERTREIGVLRAMGADNKSVRRMVLIEGLVVGVISWILGILASFPLGIGLSNAVTMAIMQSSGAFQYSFKGAAAWLFLIAIITSLASLLPAHRASQLTVREVLAYE